MMVLLLYCMPRKLEDLTGRNFGRLTILEHAGMQSVGKQRQSTWLCKCECGENVIVLNNNLKRGNTTSCGCLHKERAKESNLKDITGKRFGLLEAIEYVETKNRNVYWRCNCDCGNTTTVSTCSLNSGRTKSCGCKQGWWRSPMPGLWKDSAAYSKWQRQDPLKKLRHGVSSSIRGMLKNNGGYKRKKSIRNYLPYTIEELKSHIEGLWEPWMSWDNYGGKSNDERQTWHIDHIKPHSSFDYQSMDDPLFLECWSLSNLQPLEKKANMSKGSQFFDSTTR